MLATSIGKSFRSPIRALNVMLQQISFVILIAFLSLGAPAAYAIECVVSGPRYRLISDVVNWSIKIGKGQSCIRGLRFNNVAFESLKLISSPQSGQITLRGPSFIYSAKPEYEGEDSFTVEVLGTIRSSRGNSTIHVAVSIGGPTSAAVPHDRSPEPIATPRPPMTAPVENNIRAQSVDGALPRCPSWDWSKGSPPPMRRPFDRSKLYCPPPPFRPPGQPIGCRCVD
jgi:hypothetical protein